MPWLSFVLFSSTMCPGGSVHYHPRFFMNIIAFTHRSIQQSAALALGRLANYSDDLAEAVVQNEILPQLVSRLFDSSSYSLIDLSSTTGLFTR